MEHYQLIIKAYDRPGSIERILRVIRHRGGQIQTMSMQVEPEQKLVLNIELTNLRVKEQMVNQLVKLADIVTVN